MALWRYPRQLVVGPELGVLAAGEDGREGQQPVPIEWPGYSLIVFIGLSRTFLRLLDPRRPRTKCVCAHSFSYQQRIYYHNQSLVVHICHNVLL